MLTTLSLLLSKVIIVYLVGFLYWRRLKQDYPASVLLWTFLFAVIGLFFIPFITGLTLSKFFPQFFIPTEIFLWGGSLVGFLLAAQLFRKDKVNLWEVADSLWLTILSIVFLTQIFQSLFQLVTLKVNLSSLVFSGWLLATWGISFWLSFNFRQLSWYKSGKVGLACTLGPAIYFLGNSLLAFFLPPDLYWGRSGVVSGVSYLAISIILLVQVVRHANLKLNLLDIQGKLSQIKTYAKKRQAPQNNQTI